MAMHLNTEPARSSQPRTIRTTAHRLVAMTIALVVLSVAAPSEAQTISREQMVFLTQEWLGERFEDGRPKVPDSILQRMRAVSTEEAWTVLDSHGYRNQFEGQWKMIHDDVPVVGRALTAQYMPDRPELSKRIIERGHREGRIGPPNSWPIDALQPGDVYVADGFGKVRDGTLIGDNLGNAIYAKSGNGVVFDASARDLEGLAEIEGFNAFVRDWDPTILRDVMLTGLNTPIRIGRVTVLPGDVVLAKSEGVIFIPAHLAEVVVVRAEKTMLRDRFGHQRLRESRYTPGQIDVDWSDEIERDFTGWLRENRGDLPVPSEAIDRWLEERAGGN